MEFTKIKNNLIGMAGNGVTKTQSSSYKIYFPASPPGDLELCSSRLSELQLTAQLFIDGANPDWLRAISISFPEAIGPADSPPGRPPPPAETRSTRSIAPSCPENLFLRPLLSR